MRQRTCAALLLTAALAASPLTACTGAATPPTTQPSAGSQATLTGTVVTNGSTSMEKVIKALIEQFRTVEPGITVTYEPTGSGSGLEAAANGSADLGLASRALKESEKATLTEVVVAKDGIAIVVHPDNPVEDLTVEQVASIAKGEFTNWSQLGGPDEPIAVIGREAGSGTRSAFEELTATEDACRYHQELTSTGAVLTAVSTTPGAIGYASLSSVEQTVKLLSIAGVPCTEATILDGTYPIQRPFIFALKTDTPLSEAAQAFYEFALSADASALYTAAGVVPAAS